MNALAALGYLEVRIAHNRVRAILAKPGRAMLWLAFGGYLIFTYVKRARSAPEHVSSWAVNEPVAALIFGGYLIVLGAAFVIYQKGAVGLFASEADARFLTSARLAPAFVVAWLQLRFVATSLGRSVLQVLVFLVFLLPRGTPPDVALRAVSILASAGILLIGCGLPIYVVSQRFSRVPALLAGAGLIVAGALSVLEFAPALLTVPAGLHALAGRLPALPFGQWLLAGLAGDTRVLVALWCAAFGASLSAALCGSDLYPELYAASVKRFAVRQRRQRDPTGARGLVSAIDMRRAGSLTFVPGGALTVVWKDWLAFRRGSFAAGAVMLFLISALAGIVLGVLALRPGGDDIIVTVAGVMLNTVLLFNSLFAAVAIADDLRRPLWWLSADKLRTRLYFWVFATIWRMTVIIAAAIVAFALVARTGLAAVVGVPLMFALFWQTRSIALAVYAVFPSKTDARGPLAFVRVLLTYLLIAPAALAWILAQVVTGQPMLGAAAATLTAIAEGVLLVGFAARRFEGEGARYAIDEEN